MCNIANFWAANGKEVTLITLESETTDFYTLSSEVNRVALGLAGHSPRLWDALWNNLHRLKGLRQAIRASRADAVISFIDSMNISTLLASIGLNVPVIVSERNDPRQYHVGWVRSTLRRLLYPRASAVVVQTDRVRRWAQEFVRGEAVYSIPNPVTLPVRELDESVGPLDASHNIVAMGRLAPQKGFDLLIRAFAQCAMKYPGLSLVILGEGEGREDLVRLAKGLGIANRVSMPGTIKDPTKLLRQADLFVLSSRFEGFPNALLEAMASGLPVVSFDCPTGPREIIRDGVDGILVPPEDVEALAAAVDRLMSDEAERRRLALRAAEVTERFELEKVMAMWEAVLAEVFERRKP